MPLPFPTSSSRETARLALVTFFALFGCAACKEPPQDKVPPLSISTFNNAQPKGSDSTAAIQAAIDASQKTNRCVYLPPGNYLCGELHLNGVALIGAGPTSVLIAPDPAHAMISLGGQKPGLFGLKLVTEGKKRTNNQDRVRVDGDADSFSINNVIIDGSNATGIIVYGTRGRITENQVFNTKADAIHMSGDTHDIYVAGNLVRHSGDDCIAVVTYDHKDKTADNCHNILIENNDVGYQVWGRGIAVVGGDHVTIRNNKIKKTAWAGIYLASEDSYHTRGVSNVLVENNQIDSPSTLFPKSKHQAILIYSGTKFEVADIKVVNNRITNSPVGPFRVGPNTKDIFFSGNTYNGLEVAPREATGSGVGVTGADITSSLLGGTTAPLPVPVP